MTITYQKGKHSMKIMIKSHFFLSESDSLGSVLQKLFIVFPLLCKTEDTGPELSITKAILNPRRQQLLPRQSFATEKMLQVFPVMTFSSLLLGRGGDFSLIFTMKS